jgi:3-methyladenine DNA glycosylase AlkD
VIGAHLEKTDRALLYDLARSKDIWQKRVAIMSSFGYIKRGDPGTTLDIIDILLHDPEDLIQKAVGWMLREIGKRVDQKILEDFLDEHARDMPRTALRYALERLSPQQKSHYMGLKGRP